MDDYAYQRLYEDPASFSSGCELFYVEIYNYDDSSANLYREGRLGEHDILPWMNQQGQFKLSANQIAPCEGLRLIYYPLEEPRVVDRFQLPFSRTTFDDIFQGLNLPRLFLRVLNGRTAAFIPLPITNSILENEATSPVSVSYDLELGQSSYIFQTSHSYEGPFSIAITYDKSTSITSGFMCGGWKRNMPSLFARLQQGRKYAGHPMLLPTILAELVTEDIELESEKCHQSIHKIKLMTGMDSTPNMPGWNWRSFKSCQVQQWANCEIDFGTISKDLARAATLVAHSEYACDAMLPILCKIEKENWRHIRNLSHSKEFIQECTQALGQRNELLKCRLTGLGKKARYLSQRAQAYNHTFGHLMSQQDNAINMQTAEATLRVSEASRRDSVAMKAIAEESKMVALSTSRDSAAMRIIAAVTILFLPATFTATLFSTSFFNFQAKSQHVVSYWFWMYWLVTILLTIVIHVGWYFTSKRKELEIMSASGQSQSDLEKQIS